MKLLLSLLSLTSAVAPASAIVDSQIIKIEDERVGKYELSDLNDKQFEKNQQYIYADTERIIKFDINVFIFDQLGINEIGINEMGNYVTVKITSLLDGHEFNDKDAFGTDGAGSFIYNVQVEPTDTGEAYGITGKANFKYIANYDYFDLRQLDSLDPYESNLFPTNVQEANEYSSMVNSILPLIFQGTLMEFGNNVYKRSQLYLQDGITPIDQKMIDDAQVNGTLSGMVYFYPKEKGKSMGVENFGTININFTR